MPIDIHTFDCDTYIFDNKQLKKITLLDKKKKPHISLEFNSPLVALWSPTKTHPDCPFVCIEPWYGRCDSVGYSGELKDREWIQKLEPKETFDVEYKNHYRVIKNNGVCTMSHTPSFLLTDFPNTKISYQ